MYLNNNIHLSRLINSQNKMSYQRFNLLAEGNIVNNPTNFWTYIQNKNGTLDIWYSELRT